MIRPPFVVYCLCMGKPFPEGFFGERILLEAKQGDVVEDKKSDKKEPSPATTQPEQATQEPEVNQGNPVTLWDELKPPETKK